MERQRHPRESTLEGELDTATALRELGWVCTLGALPLLAAAVDPSLFSDFQLIEPPDYAFSAHERLFVVGLISLVLGVVQYASGLLLALAYGQGRS